VEPELKNERSSARGDLFAAMSGLEVSKALRLSALETHLLRTASIAAGLDPVGYVRAALCRRLSDDLGTEQVAKRWVP
jgi:hypothetical protein